MGFSGIVEILGLTAAFFMAERRERVLWRLFSRGTGVRISELFSNFLLCTIKRIYVNENFLARARKKKLSGIFRTLRCRGSQAVRPGIE